MMNLDLAVYKSPIRFTGLVSRVDEIIISPAYAQIILPGE